MTRAEQWLYLCCAERRRLYGNEFYARPSRFIQEVPENLIESVRLTGSVRRPITRQKTVTNSSASTQGFSSGQRVSHQKFGEGTILNAEGSGNSQRLHINFANVGNKWLMASLANLQFLP
jgi:DNA helicase-2/ATP-dependent DNA helicase PcrA